MPPGREDGDGWPLRFAGVGDDVLVTSIIRSGSLRLTPFPDVVLRAGDRVLVSCFGNGCEVLILESTGKPAAATATEACSASSKG